MGMFDWVSVSDPRFVCSEGHDLCGGEFQTKDFDCVLGYVTVGNGRVSFEPGVLGAAPDGPSFTGTFETGRDCTECPAFVQYGTGNLVTVSCDFEVTVLDGAVTGVRRTSPPTAEFLESEPKQPYMANCEGPMPYEQARLRHIHYPADVRDAWKERMRREWAERSRKR